jgi:hypothetical protein
MDRPSSNAGALQALAPALAQALRQRGLGHLVLFGKIVRHWHDIAGPQLAAVTQPESIRARVLFIMVCDAIWLQQITFYQAQLLENIRSVLGDVAITRLHFTLAMSASRQPVLPPPEPGLGPVPLTAGEEQQMRESTAGIADPDLREAVRRAWQQGWQARR